MWQWAFAPATSPPKQAVDICDLYGVVFLDPNPYRATYRVYVEKEDEYNADLIVFKETNELMADRTGLWFFTPNPAFADFSICIVDNPTQAHFKVYYTDIDAEARCNR